MYLPVIFFSAIAHVFVVLGIITLIGVSLYALSCSTERLTQEWMAMWRPVTRWLPAAFSMSPCAIALLIGLPALVLAHTIGALLR